MKKIFLLIIALLLASNSTISLSKVKETDPLEELNYNQVNSLVQATSSTNVRNWTEFRKSSTKKAFRAYGKPISIAGFSSVNSESIKDISLLFIEQNELLLGVDKTQIMYHSSNFVNGKWYVHLKQIVNGLIVPFSAIELRINNKAQVFAYGVEYFESDNIDLTSRISYQQAIANEIQFDNKKNYILNSDESGEEYAFPIYKDGAYRIESAYRAEYSLYNTDYIVYISSISGKTIFRKNVSHNAKTKIKVNTNIKEKNSQSPIVNVAVANQHIKIDGKTYTTDKDGTVEFDLINPSQVKIDFEGPWVKFSNNLFKQGQIKANIEPGSENIIEWNDSNSEIRERMVVHHLNKIRNYFKSFDNTPEAMDFQLRLFFDNDDKDANAYSNGEEIHFVGMKDPSANYAETPSVLYHEYGHSINTLLYKELGQEDGMINRAAHEGIADITSSFYLDDSRIGHGAYTNPNKSLRDCKNNFVYPDDLTGEVHHDGQILAGAMWDMRILTDLETARKLAHFARYGVPDDSDNGVCFSEWLIEILIADDDDGDLTNGTPNDIKIVAAFEQHNIGFDILIAQSLVHTQVTQLDVNNDEISIWGNIDIDNNFKQDSLELSLVYSFDGYQTFDEINFSEIDNINNDYKFNFDKIQDYGIVYYYFNIKNVTTGKLIERVKSTNGKQMFKYDFGYEEKFREKMKNNDWLFTRQNPNGASLEIAVPDKFDYGQIGIPVKQSEDSEDSDNICIVTGASQPTNNLFSSVPYGKLEAYSPTTDISSYENPVLKFELWYSKLSLVPQSDMDLHIDISSNDGDSWRRVFSTTEGLNTQNIWEVNYIELKKHIDITENFKYKISIIPNLSFSSSQGYPTTFAEFQVDNISIIDPKVISSVEVDYTDDYNVNANNETINISSTNKLSSISNIELFNINGMLITSISPTNISNSDNLIQINRGNISSGVYLLKIYDGKKVTTKKIMIFN